jgi:hypothetical protein
MCSVRTCLLKEGTKYGVNKEFSVKRRQVYGSKRTYLLQEGKLMSPNRTCLLQEGTFYWVNKDLTVTRRHDICAQ